MGGGSKKQTIGYKYYLGMHMVLSHGPIDALLRIRVDNRDAWTGSASGGSYTINAPNLFGGDEREGGVSGTFDFESGAPTQGQNSYLASQISGRLPNFRGVSAMVLRQMYMGNNPYLKRWSMLCQRIFKAQDGAAQWETNTAAIPGDDPLPLGAGSINVGSPVVLVGKTDSWRYKLVTKTDTADYSGAAYDDSTWAYAPGPFGDRTHPHAASAGWPATPTTQIDAGQAIWIRARNLALSATQTIYLEYFADNTSQLWVNGVEVGVTRTFGWDPDVTLGGRYVGEIPPGLVVAGPNNTVALKVVDAGNFSDVGNYIYAGFTASAIPDTTSACLDMNPSHIIRECLTNMDWGMGYLAADIDDASFLAAANTLVAEGFGLSFIWDRQIPIEDFVKEVIRHIDATLYVSRSTGKFILKLIRADYNPATLLVLDENSVDKVEGLTHKSFGEQVNSVTVNFWDRQRVQPGSVTVQDTALVQMQGVVIATTIQYPGVSYPSLASRLASRDLQSLSTPLLSCTVFADTTAATLNIGDPFKLDWPDFFAEPVIFRVVGMALGDGKNNRVRLTCAQDVFGMPALAAVTNPGDPGDTWTPPDSTPVALSRRVVSEATYHELVQNMGETTVTQLLASQPDSGLLYASAGRAGASLNIRIWVDSGNGYQDSGQTDFCPIAKSPTAKPAETETYINITEAKDMDLVAVGSYCQWEQELCEVLEVSPTQVRLGRGVLDTVPVPHAADTWLYFWDAYAGSDNTEYSFGETIQVKLLPQSGSGSLPLANAPADPLTFNRRALRPIPPGNFQINGAYFPAKIGNGAPGFSWAHRNRLLQTTPDLLNFTAGSISTEAGVTYTITFKNGAGVVKNTQTGLTGTSIGWGSESVDSGVLAYINGAHVQVLELFNGSIPGGFATLYNNFTSPTPDLQVSYQPRNHTVTLINNTSQHSMWMLTQPGLCELLFDAELAIESDPTNRNHFGLWFGDANKTIRFGYRLVRLDNNWQFDRVDGPDTGVITTTTIATTAGGPAYADGTRYRFRVERSVSGVFKCYINGSLLFTVTDTTYGALIPGIYVWNATVRLYELMLVGRQAVARLNSQITVELKSVRSGYDSFQTQQHTAYRAGYGYSYGKSYGA